MIGVPVGGLYEAARRGSTMALKVAKRDGWGPFLLIAAAGAAGIYVASTLQADTIAKTAAMAIIGIIVVAAYEYFIGWG